MALGLCLIWGYGGMLSFGQTAFFGLAGYSLRRARHQYRRRLRLHPRSRSCCALVIAAVAARSSSATS